LILNVVSLQLKAGRSVLQRNNTLVSQQIKSVKWDLNTITIIVRFSLTGDYQNTKHVESKTYSATYMFRPNGSHQANEKSKVVHVAHAIPKPMTRVCQILFTKVR